jgi:putative ABC transport system permease protein
MFAYYLRLGFRHLRRNPVLTALIVVTLAVGVAASMATLTVLYGMSVDPIPHKSDRLFVPLLDLRPLDAPSDEPDPPSQLSYRDAVALRELGGAVRQTSLIGVSPVVDPGRADQPPFFGEGAAVHADFFAMFDVPFARGGAWSAEDDVRGGKVVVIRASLADKVFDDADPIGETMRLGADDYVVTGVVPDSWRPTPKFYRLVAGPGAFGTPEQLFVPFATAIAAKMDPQGNVQCTGKDDPTGYEGLKQSECVWIQHWVELDSAGDADRYRDLLAGYVAQQRTLGRFPRPDNQRLHDVGAWLEVNKVVSKDARLQTYLAFGFLLVCLVNVVGLLLAKFTARAGEIGVRRALGASRRAVFAQYLTEVGVVGLIGGAVGLLLTFGCLWLIGKQSKQLAAVASMDWLMLATTFVLAIGASLAAGLLPTWRACQVQPAVQLKSQ